MTKVSNGEKKTKRNDEETHISITRKESQYKRKVRSNMLKFRNLTYKFKEPLIDNEHWGKKEEKRSYES